VTTIDDRNLPDLDTIAPVVNPMPGLAQLLNPVFQFHWGVSFVQCWFLSRDYSRPWQIVPVVLLMVLGVVLWFERWVVSESLVTNYEQAIEQAASRGDNDEAMLLAKALEALRPADLLTTYNTALLLAKDSPDEALSRMLELAPDGRPGFAPARLWLVRQARGEKPLLTMTASQMKSQLLQALESSPNDAEATRLLAEIYLESSEWVLAEQQLSSLVVRRPDLSLQLAKVKTKLGRDRVDIQQYLSQAESLYRDHLAAHPDDADVWMALSETMLVSGQSETAREILVEQLAKKDNPSMRRQLSDQYLSQAETLANASPLNLDRSLALCLSAVEVDPGNPAILTSLLLLQSRGARISGDQLKKSTEFWGTRLNETPENAELRVITAQYLAFTGDLNAAAETLAPVLESRPDLLLPHIELLKSAGRVEESDALLQKMIGELQDKHNASKNDAGVVISLAQALLFAGQPEKVRELFKDSPLMTQGNAADTAKLQGLLGSAAIQLYDRVLIAHRSSDAAPWTDEEGKNVLELLQESLAVPSTSVGALQRLATMAFSDLPPATRANELIQRIRLNGSGNSEVLSLIGAMALLAGKNSESVGFFRFADAAANGKDPAILNNLAMAQLREGKADLNSILDLSNSALKSVPDNPDFLSTRAEIYIALKRWQEALADLLKALPTRTGDGSLHLLLSKVYSELGDSAMAEQHAARATEIGSK
jgi:tetratricopeptide (TPR) repeat protein